MNRLYLTFVQVVESQTLVRAAEALHLTQPTVSRQLQQLETEIGHAMFERISGRLVLTRAGELVYQTAKHLLSTEQKMREDLASLGNPEVGTIYLGAGVTPSIYLLPQALSVYREDHKGVMFHLQTGSSREIVDALLKREIDLGIVTTVPTELHNLVDTTPMYRDDLLLVASPEHPLARRSALTVRDLDGAGFIVMPAASGLRELTEALTRRHAVDVKAIMEADSLESISRLVQCGMGISFLPRSCVQDDLLMQRLVVLHLMDEPPRSRTITLVCRQGRNLTAPAELFASWLPKWFERTFGRRERMTEYE